MVYEVKQLEDLEHTMLDASEVVQEIDSQIDPMAEENQAAPSEVDLPLDSSASIPTETTSEKVAHDVETPATEPENFAGDASKTEEAVSPAAKELLQQIESLKLQLEDRTAQFMRIAADFDNFRKRTQKEKEDLELQIKCSTVIELLPVIDNFERARSQIKPQGEEGLSIHKSYQGVYKDFVDRLKKIGVAPMRSEGKEFDPNLHEAVMREATHEYPEGTVMEELVRGYLLGERVLRHAMVKVSAPVEADESEES